MRGNSELENHHKNPHSEQIPEKIGPSSHPEITYDKIFLREPLPRTRLVCSFQIMDDGGQESTGLTAGDAAMIEAQ